MLENTDGLIKNGQSRETGSIGYTRRRQAKQKHNAICVGIIHSKTLLFLSELVFNPNCIVFAKLRFYLFSQTHIDFACVRWKFYINGNKYD